MWRGFTDSQQRYSIFHFSTNFFKPPHTHPETLAVRFARLRTPTRFIIENIPVLRRDGRSRSDAQGSPPSPRTVIWLTEIPWSDMKRNSRTITMYNQKSCDFSYPVFLLQAIQSAVLRGSHWVTNTFDIAINLSCG